MRYPSVLTGVVVCLLLSTSGQAETFTNILAPDVEFPGGAASFADVLIDYSPGIVTDPAAPDVPIPLPPYLGGHNTLGVPDADLQNSIDCANAPSTDTCKYASLGVGGVLIVRFTDNLLTGSGAEDPDLFIFQAGPNEPTFVDVSVDGVDWANVGIWANFNVGIDIDAFGFGVGDEFAFVRLRDEAETGNMTGITVGLDVDAIGAISTVIIPLPAAGWLFASSIGLLSTRRFRRRCSPENSYPAKESTACLTSA